MAMIKSIGRELWSSQGPWGRKEDKGGEERGKGKSVRLSGTLLSGLRILFRADKKCGM